MNTKRSILVACTVLTLSAGTAMAGPCSTGSAADKDAGSGPTVGSAQSHSSDAAGNTGQHPPTSTMNRASGETPASSEDAQRQMQGQPTAAQRAEGAKPNAMASDEGC